jgi:hypothetical protein
MGSIPGRRTIKELLQRSLIAYLAAAMVILTSIPADVHAMFLPSDAPLAHGDSFSQRQQNLDRLQKLLESRLVSQRLSDLGFSQKDISSRLDRLSDEQLHYFASHLEGLQTGGDGLVIVIVLLLVAILAVVALQLSGHKIIITK